MDTNYWIKSLFLDTFWSEPADSEETQVDGGDTSGLFEVSKDIET